MDKKPNFFIVGAPKAGTTSLYHYLEQHPEIYMSPIKETNYFSRPEINSSGLFYKKKNEWTIDQYAEQFEGLTTEKAIGEASVSYLFYPNVPYKIKQFNPDAKIIIMLRNPIDRGFSHYLMDRRVGFTNLSYEDIVYRKEFEKNNTRFFYQQYVELGMYYSQIKRYLDIFSPEKVKILYFEDVIKDIEMVVKEVYKFLGVDDKFMAETEKKFNTFQSAKSPLIAKLYAQKRIRKVIKRLVGIGGEALMKRFLFSRENKPVMSPNLKRELIDIYKADVLKTGELLNKDLSNWIM
ncbi:MAG: sulfotransferase family protein [Ilyomonas sp.]